MTDPRIQYEQTWRVINELRQQRREPLWIKVAGAIAMLALLILCGFIATTL